MAWREVLLRALASVRTTRVWLGRGRDWVSCARGWGCAASRSASTWSFEIEAHRDIVKLTLTHGHLRSREELHAVGQGWPAVLSNLKTLLETEDVLPQAPWEFHADERAARMAKNG